MKQRCRQQLIKAIFFPHPRVQAVIHPYLIKPSLLVRRSRSITQLLHLQMRGWCLRSRRRETVIKPLERKLHALNTVNILHKERYENDAGKPCEAVLRRIQAADNPGEVWGQSPAGAELLSSLWVLHQHIHVFFQLRLATGWDFNPSECFLAFQESLQKLL